MTSPSSGPSIAFPGAAALLLLLTASLSAQSSAAPEPITERDETVQMEAFNVSTSIGAYHEETSSMATKIPTDLKELPSSLQILNANSIKDRNALTLQDVYQYIVGLTQTQQNANGFNFRGFPNSGTLTQNIQIDGLMGSALKRGAVSAANVESIEFLKGPNSVLYGQMHPGGLLNVVSKSPMEVRQTYLRATFSTWAGDFNRFGSKNGETLIVDVTGPLDQGKHWLYRFIADAENSPPFRLGDNDRLLSLYPSLTYAWSEQTYFTVKMEVSQDKRRTDNGLVPIFTQGVTYGSAARWTEAPFNTVYQDLQDIDRDRGEVLSTNFHTQFGSNWTFRTQTRSVWHTDFSRTFTNNAAGVYLPNVGYATPGSTMRRQYNYVINGHRYNFFDANLYGQVGPSSLHNTVLVGTGGGQEFYDQQRLAQGPVVTPAVTLIDPILGQTPYPTNPTGILDQRNTLTNFGVYATDQMRLGERVHLSVGTRYDQQESHAINNYNPVVGPYTPQFVTSVTSQAGVVFDLTRTLSTYASWSQSVVPNTVTSIDASGHAGFPPEKGEQYETGLKFETVDKSLFASLAAYYINRTNVLVGTGTNLPVTGQSIFRLDGAQHSEGFEFETQWLPIPNWQVQAGGTLSKAFVAASVKNPQTIGLDLSAAPRATANFWTRYNIPGGPLKGLGLGLGAIYVGKYWGGDASTAVYFPVPGWTRLDAAIYYKWRRYDLGLNIQNALDRRYIAAVQSANYLIPGDERKMTFSVAVHF